MLTRVYYLNEIETDDARRVRTDKGNMMVDMMFGLNFYNKQNPDRPITKENLDETHTRVALTLVEETLEELFERMQGEFMSEETLAVMRDQIGCKNISHTSMSVGDIVERDGVLWFCDKFSWEKLS